MAIDVSVRSAPIKPLPDGKYEWAGQTFPDEETAKEARRIFRAITFGMVYGGFR